ncbi:MAG: hypothetical protein A2X25_00265 [Chloroflexi bacterium GWB2_49_20]|nr:MAG: hypothetical protein A2X25_00265 [Chloroflexi bacterium GWB2_49_20]OGN79107.1 MAG: hypothetical protein A2X26_06115 [Chloroflexi bacterium GWC2_49_37]OGN84903.1 MAG: hypothetical protein A2X27_15155 [Chloroflexi bacterium GWD2_49_16]HCC78037.1 hypothetical protein [Anaerolineae bacterium]HCM96611.1 hypothetical protein [Anaerolineae bacterium]
MHKTTRQQTKSTSRLIRETARLLLLFSGNMEDPSLRLSGVPLKDSLLPKLPFDDWKKGFFMPPPIFPTPLELEKEGLLIERLVLEEPKDFFKLSPSAIDPVLWG